MLQPLHLTLVALIMLGGSLVYSTVGFGIAITTSPLLLLFLEPQTVVILLNTVPLVLGSLLLLQTRAHLPARDMTPVAVAGVLGAPVGVALLSVASVGALRIGIALLVLLMTATLGLGKLGPISLPRIAGPLAGLFAGVLLASTGIGGPILVLLLLAQGRSKQEIRASMAVFLMVIELASVSGYAVAGMFTSERIALILSMVAPALLGFIMATRLVRTLDERRFRQGVVAVILASSVMVLGREALHLQAVF